MAGKPNGIDSAFRVLRSTPAEDAVWDAVERVLLAGWSVERFRREAAQAWAQKQRDIAKSDAEDWECTRGH